MGELGQLSVPWTPHATVINVAFSQTFGLKNQHWTPEFKKKKNLIGKAYFSQ